MWQWPYLCHKKRVKMATCKKCGISGLEWRKSAKDKWYLADPRTISTNTYGNFITIPFAHKCIEKTQEEPRSKEYYEVRLAQLIEKQTLHPEWMKQSDINELDMCKFQLEEMDK